MIVQIEMEVGPKMNTLGNTGNTHSREAKDAISDYRSGKKATLETRKRMSESHVCNGEVRRRGRKGHRRKDYADFLGCSLHWFDTYYKHLFI